MFHNTKVVGVEPWEVPAFEPYEFKPHLASLEFQGNAKAIIEASE